MWGNSGPDAVAGEEEGGLGWGSVRVWGQVHVPWREAHRNYMAPFKGASDDCFCKNSASLEFLNWLANKRGVTFRGQWDGGEDEKTTLV